jgi:hypothetical protein
MKMMIMMQMMKNMVMVMVMIQRLSQALIPEGSTLL